MSVDDIPVLFTKQWQKAGKHSELRVEKSKSKAKNHKV